MEPNEHYARQWAVERAVEAHTNRTSMAGGKYDDEALIATATAIHAFVGLPVYPDRNCDSPIAGLDLEGLETVSLYPGWSLVAVTDPEGGGLIQVYRRTIGTMSFDMDAALVAMAAEPASYLEREWANFVIAATSDDDTPVNF